MSCCLINGSCTSGKFIGGLILAAGIIGAVGIARADREPEKAAPAAAAPAGDAKSDSKAAKSMHDFTVKNIDGKDVNLADYKGKVCLVVNVASKCGYTRQYEGLEKLYKAKKDSGLVILGFPSNDFGGQEPGTEAEIKEFCSSKFNVTFPLFAKIAVKGDSSAPLYSNVTPDDSKLTGKIDELLAKNASAESAPKK
jgi:glutathione peroxidase